MTELRLISVLALLFWLFAPTTSAQSKDAKPCNENMTFCWYNDDVDAWGTLWKSDDPAEKSLEQVTEVRCVQRLHVCIKARNQKVNFGLPSVTNIDLYNVRSWDGTQIRAVMDEQIDPDCEQDTLVINRVDRSVVIISSPGPRGNEKRCTGLMGQPKTVVYRLTSPQLETIGSGEKGEQK